MAIRTREMRYHYKCPWCGKGETLADGKGKVTISAQCGRCGGFYLADLDTGVTEKAKPQRRQGRAR